MNIKPASELYPDFREGYSTGDYYPILESFGEILVQSDDDDYQGDSRVLYRDADRYGILIFGWGSCSGCDALQAADTLKEVDELIAGLADGIRWGSLGETIDYMKTHDWGGDFSCHSDETKVFVRDAIAVLEDEKTKQGE